MESWVVDTQEVILIATKIFNWNSNVMSVHESIQVTSSHLQTKSSRNKKNNDSISLVIERLKGWRVENKRTIDLLKVNCQSRTSNDQASRSINQSYVTMKQWMDISIVLIQTKCNHTFKFLNPLSSIVLCAIVGVKILIEWIYNGVPCGFYSFIELLRPIILSIPKPLNEFRMLTCLNATK